MRRVEDSHRVEDYAEARSRMSALLEAQRGKAYVTAQFATPSDWMKVWAFDEEYVEPELSKLMVGEVADYEESSGDLRWSLRASDLVRDSRLASEGRPRARENRSAGAPRAALATACRFRTRRGVATATPLLVDGNLRPRA